MANWFFIQFREEQDHARIFMNYLNSRDAKVVLRPIDAVPTEWPSIQAMFEQTLDHERKVTKMINGLAAIAHSDSDFASLNRLTWFIDEQVEEEDTARQMIQAFASVENNKYGLYQLDKELEARVYSAPSPLAAN